MTLEKTRGDTPGFCYQECHVGPESFNIQVLVPWFLGKKPGQEHVPDDFPSIEHT